MGKNQTRISHNHTLVPNGMSKNSFIPALRYKWLTPFYDRILNLTFPEKKIKGDLIRELELKGNESILDFGCGTGTLSLMIKEQFPSVTLIGIDVDRDVLSIAETKAKQKGLAIFLIKYDGEHLPFNDHQQFDNIISSLVFHHLPTAQKAKILHQLYHILKSGGKLQIADFGKPKNWYTKIAFGIFRRFDGEENTRVNARGLLPEFIANAGFTAVEESSAYNTLFGTMTLIKAVK